MTRSGHLHQNLPKSPTKRLEMRYSSAIQSQRPPRRSNTSTIRTKPNFSTPNPNHPRILITPAQSMSGPTASQLEAAKITALPPIPAMSLTVEQEVDAALSTSPMDLSIQDFAGHLDVTSDIPSKDVLDKIADLAIFDKDGKQVLFKSLYWPNDGQRRTVMIIFIRHFLCGNCREYLRTLTTYIPPSSLPPSTSIAIVGCGSPTLIPSYLAEVGAFPYPIFADPSKRLYSLLGMHRTLSMGSKDPGYIRQSLATSVIKSIVQGVKRLPKGDVMQGGDMRLNGGEFLFEVDGGSANKGANIVALEGNDGLARLKVTFCHRMRNTRDHTEISEIRTVLKLSSDPAQTFTNERSHNARRRWSKVNLVRSLSNRSQSLRRSFSRSSRREGHHGSESQQSLDQNQQRVSSQSTKTTATKLVDNGPRISTRSSSRKEKQLPGFPAL